MNTVKTKNRMQIVENWTSKPAAYKLVSITKNPKQLTFFLFPAKMKKKTS